MIINYIKQLNSFYDLLQGNPLTSSAQLLYHTLLMVNNACGWPEWFQRTNQSLCGLLGVNEKTLVTARNTLKQNGLIDFLPARKKGEITRYHILKLYDEGNGDSCLKNNAGNQPYNFYDFRGVKKGVQNTSITPPYSSPETVSDTIPQSTDIYKLYKSKEKETGISSCSRDQRDEGMLEEDKDTSSSVFDFYESNLADNGIVGGHMTSKLLEAIDTYGNNLVLLALQKAVENGAKRWNYANAVLRDWSRKGIRTPEGVQEEEESRSKGTGDARPAKTNRRRTLESKFNSVDWNALEG